MKYIFLMCLPITLYVYYTLTNGDKMEEFDDIKRIEKIKEYAQGIQDNYARKNIIDKCDFEIDLIKSSIFKKLGKIEYEKILANKE